MHGKEAVEVAGGDRRIATATLQIDALERMGFPLEPYKFLLAALQFNEEHDRLSLAGFAFGLERLAMTLYGIPAIDRVQIFPMNSSDGSFIHATGRKI